MLQRLLDGIYMPHGYCLLWEPWLVGLHAVSDSLTFAAYSAIPLAIWMFVSKRPNIEMKGLARLFAAFILWCGLTHIFNVITLWYPIYELQGLVKAITAGISVTTAVLIFPLIPKALAIPSPNELQLANAQLEREVAAHKQTLAELQQAREELEGRVAERTRDLADATERFKALFEYAPVAMLMIGQDGAVDRVNAAAEQIFLCKREELLGKPVEELLPTAHRSTHPQLRQAYVNHPQARPMGAGRELFAQRKNGEHFPIEIGLNPIPGTAQAATIASIVDISSRRKAEQRMQFVMRELSHRSKNLLAVIQGMVRQAIAASPDMRTFESSFTERLQGLARSHDLLVGKNWEGASLAEIVRTQLAFLKYGDGTSIVMNGADIELAPEAAQSVGLALHELATNAVKHGALSVPTGTIDVQWKVVSASEGTPHVEFIWAESGGPVSRDAQRKGFGRTVLERVVPRSLGGNASLIFADTGVRWQLDFPLPKITHEGRETAAA